MKIGYLTGQYPRATDTFIQREVGSLRQQGLDVETFSVRAPNPEQLVGEEQKSEFEQTTYLLPPNIFQLLIAHVVLFLTGFAAYAGALKLAWMTRQLGIKGLLFQIFYFLEAGLLAHELKRRKIQHLHNHIADSSCTVAMLAAELSGLSFSFTIHGPYIFFEPDRWALETKIARAQFVVCISHFCRSQCMLFSAPENWSKLHIIHCGVEPDLFKSREHREVGQNLLYVGRLSAAKGLPILFEAIANLKHQGCDPLKLIVIGDGSDRQSLETLSKTLKISDSIDFVGYKSQSEVRQYLSEVDIFVLPSFAEGVPVSLMEAMASGLPVVSTQIAGISELIEDGQSGFLVPPGKTEAIVEKIKLLYSHTSLRNSFGLKGRQFVSQEFNLNLETKKLSQIFLTQLSQ